MLPVIARERKEEMRTLVRIYSRAANVVTGERGLQIGIYLGQKTYPVYRGVLGPERGYTGGTYLGSHVH